MIAASNAERRIIVEKFLTDFKSVAKDQKPYVVSREKNLEILIKLGLTLTNQWQILLELGVEDYVSGPEPDRDRAGEVWMFGKYIGTVEIYIKIKLVEYTPIDTRQLIRKAICISFHPAEQPQVYPLK